MICRGQRNTNQKMKILCIKPKQPWCNQNWTVVCIFLVMMESPVSSYWTFHKDPLIKVVSFQVSLIIILLMESNKCPELYKHTSNDLCMASCRSVCLLFQFLCVWQWKLCLVKVLRRFFLLSSVAFSSCQPLQIIHINISSYRVLSMWSFQMAWWDFPILIPSPHFFFNFPHLTHIFVNYEPAQFSWSSRLH